MKDKNCANHTNTNTNTMETTDNKTIDRKFIFRAINPVNGNIYTEADALLLCAKDAAVPAALLAYKNECERLGANPEHIKSVGLLLERVKDFQFRNGQRIPDTLGDELPRCIDGILTKDEGK